MNAASGMLVSGNGQKIQKALGSPYSSSDFPSLNIRYLASSPAPPPPTTVLLEGYRATMRNGSEDRPRYNPLNASRPRSSPLLNVNDPVAMHLLIETAISDSQEYEILSFEEVDDMKKEFSLLSNRVEAAKRRLALESKVREAAMSLSRLYSKKSPSESAGSSPRKHRRSFLGSRGSGTSSGSDTITRTDDEVAISTRKCEELATELWTLERRTFEIQRRLLHHTSGILQMTHGGADASKHSSMPGNTSKFHDGNTGDYTHLAESQTGSEDDNIFDARSLYRLPENLDELSSSNTPKHAIPQTASLHPGLNQTVQIQLESIKAMELKLHDLNNRIREMITQANPSDTPSYDPTPQVHATATPQDVEISLQMQLQYLEKALSAMNGRHAEELRFAKQSEVATEESLEELNNQIRELIIQASSPEDEPHPFAPQVSGRGLPMQLNFLEDALATIGRLFREHLQSSSSKSASQQDKADQIETFLMGLWDILITGEEEERQRKIKRREAHAEEGGRNNDSELSPDEESPSSQKFSIQAFSSKVQRLYALATGLKEQKAVLRRQIRQQRELNKKSDTEHAAELEKVSQQYAAADREALNARQELAVVMQRLESARRESIHREQQRGNEDSNALKTEREDRKLSEEKLLAQLMQMQGDLAAKSEALDAEKDERRLAEEKLLAELMLRQEELASKAEALQIEKEERRLAEENLLTELSRREEELISKAGVLQVEKEDRKLAEERLTSELTERQERLISELAESQDEVANKIEELEAEKEDRKLAEQSLISDLLKKQEEVAKLIEELENIKHDRRIANAEVDGVGAETESRIYDIERQLHLAIEEKEEAELARESLNNKLKEKEVEAERVKAEMRDLEGEVVRLQTEVTIARAELDGAYGTRAQRAAEVAANPAIQREIDDLTIRNNSLLAEIAALKSNAGSNLAGSSEMQKRIDTLQQELRETIGEYEAMTKASIEFEKEREQQEHLIDNLRDRCEALETQLADEKVRSLGVKGPAQGSGSTAGLAESTSTTVLKNEFKKMMRDTRAENLKALRAEQEERRKLEVAIRNLRKEQAPGRSGLSQSISAHS
ncbi:MAG: hypothetical protein M1829_004202 [Trizodia sp. TS-e1964]|nr:MAG: hypothetical protein M1829_004202 [Trizodia sp. TS-e1964]